MVEINIDEQQDNSNDNSYCEEMNDSLQENNNCCDEENNNCCDEENNCSEEILEEVDINGDGSVIKKILRYGEGELPKSEQEIVAHYRGTLEDGSEFDSSYSRNDPFKFILNQGNVIKAWDLCFSTMKKGEKAIIHTSSEYGYGTNGSPPKILPDASLIFDVELLDFRDKQKEIWEMGEQERIEGHQKSKDSAKELFKNKNYSEAFNEYSQSLRYIESNHNGEENETMDKLRLSVLINLSITACKLEDWVQSKNYSEKALEMEPQSVKALYRMAFAESELWNIESSNKYLEQILQIEPDNKSALNKTKFNKNKQQKQNKKDRDFFAKAFA